MRPLSIYFNITFKFFKSDKKADPLKTGRPRNYKCGLASFARLIFRRCIIFGSFSHLNITAVAVAWLIRSMTALWTFISHIIILYLTQRSNDYCRLSIYIITYFKKNASTNTNRK